MNRHSNFRSRMRSSAFTHSRGCEKLFKALIGAYNEDYPFDHSLVKLFGMLASKGEILPELPYDIFELDPFATRFRYEISEMPLLDTERPIIRQSIRQLRDHILTRIIWLESALA